MRVRIEERLGHVAFLLQRGDVAAIEQESSCR